jgi:CRISPR/Cas system Type II protein with McrA/HNH and RuvC-like nuclease domain
MEATARLQKSREHRRHLIDDYERLYEKLAASANPTTAYEMQQLEYLAGKIKCASKVLEAEIAMMNRCLIDLNRLKAKTIENNGRGLAEKSPVAEVPRTGFR